MYGHLFVRYLIVIKRLLGKMHCQNMYLLCIKDNEGIGVMSVQNGFLLIMI